MPRLPQMSAGAKSTSSNDVKYGRSDSSATKRVGCSSDPVPSGTATARPRVLCAPFRVAAAHLHCNGQRASVSSCCDAAAALPSLPSQPASHRGSAGAARARYRQAAAPPTVARQTRHRRPFSSPTKAAFGTAERGAKACRTKVAGSVHVQNTAVLSKLLSGSQKTKCTCTN